MALSLLSLSLSARWSTAGAGYIAAIVASSIVRPASVVFQQSAVEAGDRQAMSGATTMSAGLAFFAASYLGGLIAATAGFRRLFLIEAGITTAALLFLVIVVRPRARARF
jgi:predicted MFS family arabinose efflux permease